MLVYGRYQNIRNAAWQCLIDFYITALPVDVLAIARAVGIKVVKNSKVNLLTGCENGAAFRRKGIWYIVYNDDCSSGMRRFTIAHELGHIFLGMTLLMDITVTQ